jgi:hypothetical protein
MSVECSMRVGKRALGGPRCRWEGNCGIHLIGITCSNLHWICFAHASAQWRALVNMEMTLLVP